MTSLGLVADYSSSDDEKDSQLHQKLTVKEAQREPTNFFHTTTDSTPVKKKPKKSKKSKKEKLMNPRKGLMCLNKGGSSLSKPFQVDETTSVFYNPFHKEQEAKTMMLEKHVKLTENPKNVLEINGKKICFNYRKGRCKFGHNCKFAHDSDLNIPVPEVVPKESLAATLYNSSSGTLVPEEDNQNRKRKPGLSEGLVPNKRARENFRSQQKKESPWLMKRLQNS